jgi:hypothetical protein
MCFLSFPGVAITKPFVASLIIVSSILVKTLIDFLKFPGLLLESNSTEMMPDCPGFISSVDQLGAVQPQPALTFNILNGSSPVLENLKSTLWGLPSSFILPKLYSNVSNLIIGLDSNITHASNNKLTKIIFFILNS